MVALQNLPLLNISITTTAIEGAYYYVRSKIPYQRAVPAAKQPRYQA